MNASTHQVHLHFSDGATETIRARSGQSLLDAALEADLPVLYQCRSGSCSSCVASLKSGSTSSLPGQSSTLLESEYQSGQRLLCACQATSDCEISLSYGRDAGATPVTQASAFINAIEAVADDVVRLTLELAEGHWINFKPGQYLQIEVPGVGQLRSYSPYSTSADLPLLHFLIRLQPGGVMARYLAEQAAVDQVLNLTGPFGAFFLHEEHLRRPHLFIAGGTGLAPMLSMLDAIRLRGGIRPRMLLSFGCSSASTLFGVQDIQLRQQWMPTLDTRICVSREAVPGCLQKNLIEAIEPGEISPDAVAYLCGPPGMVDSATRRLLEQGVKPEHIFTEAFVASE